MNLPSQFKIYSASAGSGKTFTLTKNYLSKLLLDDGLFAFRHILAITFTNKAVGEMKSRILGTLEEFSSFEIGQSPSEMFIAVREQTGLDEVQINQKSKAILKFLLDNYAAFEVSTIDAFTHKVIRTFAKDLKLSLNFDVELEAKEVLEEAVDRVINKVGEDQELSNVLIEFSISKINDDKSGDIKADIFNVAQLILNEADLPYLDALSGCSLQDYVDTKKQLKSKIKTCNEHKVQVAQSLLEALESHQVSDQFTRNSIPNFFKKIIENPVDIKLSSAKWAQNIEDPSTYYSKKASAQVIGTLEALSPQIVKSYTAVIELHEAQELYTKIHDNITQLSVVQLVKQELEAIKEEKNILLISDFNQKINQEIKHQPTPFIYERLGEKFRHYFIDEFQDTSTLQWENLKPLIENALGSSYNGTSGTATLVGDPKQSIYAWRGGDVQQFTQLINAQTDLPVKPTILNLGSNFRSRETIVNFNNQFFEMAAAQMKSPLIKDIYKKEKLGQQPVNQKQGLVSISFIKAQNKTEENNLYSVEVHKRITKTIAQGFQLKDICVLVRTKAQGVILANYLQSQGIKIISSETLLINTNPKVIQLTSFLKYLLDPLDLDAKYQFLSLHCQHQSIALDYASLKALIAKPFDAFIGDLENFNIKVNPEKIKRLGVYAAVEYALQCLQLNGNAFLQFFLDEVFQFSQNKTNSLKDFMSYWEEKGDTKSISLATGFNAVSIMTVHKSKGLEFPVVIYPFVNQNFHDLQRSHLWYSLDQNFSLPHAFVPNLKALESQKRYHEAYLEQLYQEEIDQFNVLYVAFTRAESELHIISKLDAKPNSSRWSTLLKQFVEANHIQGESNYYEIGQPVCPNSVEVTDQVYNLAFSTEELLALEMVDELTQPQTDEALYGVLIHDLLAKIYTLDDITRVTSALDASQLDVSLIKDRLNAVVSHDELSAFFSAEWQIFNERDITYKGDVLRPDKFCIKENTAVVIDYKTGEKNLSHQHQIKAYGQALEAVGYTVKAMILVYISDQIDVINV